MSELKRRLKQEKQEFMIKSIGSLQEGNTKQLFSQFRSMNSNKITVIILVSWFDQPPQSPDFSSEIEEHYQLVEDEIRNNRHYQLWKANHEFKEDERFCWLGKLSTLSRAYIHGAEANKPPMQISKLPHPVKSPFEKWCEPTQEEILNNKIVIFADGSKRQESKLSRNFDIF
ncbi:hypothetical protein RFI_35519 [Reticulomyxa filosa]|uniref:Uncharacterized protein n=1 Tax=Reticulomyxa filosa TaxID=46433 RepID=X6LMJ4_RETFI|nr:hypothetical protein RFI_35519 [Reticulomyxa filosa]|eukprot:ETO01920.1 hypothetical protein RFI_35519 [Reticulomyxa filosa]